MGSRLIFLHLWESDGLRNSGLGVGCPKKELAVPGNSPHIKTVPQTDTGGWDEYSKALERTRVKELGKIVP